MVLTPNQLSILLLRQEPVNIATIVQGSFRGLRWQRISKKVGEEKVQNEASRKKAGSDTGLLVRGCVVRCELMHCEMWGVLQ